MRAATESSLVSACLAHLHWRGCLAWRQNTTGVYDRARGVYRFHGMRGVSDILALAPDGSGRLVAVECKSAKGKLTPEQSLFLDNVRAHGGVAVVVRDVSDLIAALAAEFGEG